MNRRNPERVDSGLSLIELIVVVVLIGIMGSAIAIIFVNSWRTQNTVMSMSQATNRGQFLGQSIERAARNSDAIRITNDGHYVGFRIRKTGGGYACAAFKIASGSPSDSFLMSAATPLPLPTSGSWPKAWLDSNVQTNGGPYFAVTTLGTPPAPVVTYSFQITTSAAPVTISGEASGRGQGILVSTDSSPQGAAPCWS